MASAILQHDFLSTLPEHLLNIISGFCLISGVYDVSPLIHTSENKKLILSENEVKALSPMFASYGECLNNKIKIIVTVGEYDSPAFILQSKEYQKILNSTYSNVQFVLVDGYDHFNIVEDLYIENYFLTKLILKNILTN